MPDIRPMLIEAVKARPALWMSSHPHHKVRLFQNRYWKEVLNDLPASKKITVELVKKQWKSLKDVYRKELKKPYQQWKLCDQMSFMRDEIKLVRKPGSPSTWAHYVETAMSETNQDENNSRDSSEKDTKDLLDNADFDWPDKSPGDPLSGVAGFRNFTAHESDDYHFLMSILPEMEKLPPVQKMRLRTKINSALLEEMENTYKDK